MQNIHEHYSWRCYFTIHLQAPESTTSRAAQWLHEAPKSRSWKLLAAQRRPENGRLTTAPARHDTAELGSQISSSMLASREAVRQTGTQRRQRMLGAKQKFCCTILRQLNITTAKNKFHMVHSSFARAEDFTPLLESTKPGRGGFMSKATKRYLAVEGPS